MQPASERASDRRERDQTQEAGGSVPSPTASSSLLDPQERDSLPPRVNLQCGYRAPIDWQLFHYLNDSLRGHPLIGDEVEDFVTFWAVPLFVIATFSLWLFDRPGRADRWKAACLSGLASAGLGLLIAQVISHIWVRERPFVAHPSETLLLAAPSHEPSFPSDHAVAAFAIAFSVILLGSRRAGALFLVGATAVGITRVFVGLHYPGDVVGGSLVGLVAALIVYYGGRYRWSPIIGLLSRFTDPLLTPAWRALDAQRKRHGLRTR